MADSARKRSALRFAGHAGGAPAREVSRRYGAAPLTIFRLELIVNSSDREFRELVRNLFGFLHCTNGSAEAMASSSASPALSTRC